MWGRGVLPAALPAPISATLSPALLVYLRECGATGSASVRTACAIHPTLHQSRSCHSNASPLPPVPVSAPPTGLDECLFFISLVSDPLAVGFSVSSGCAGRRGVSTCAAILVLYYVHSLISDFPFSAFLPPIEFSQEERFFNLRFSVSLVLCDILLCHIQNK